MCAGCGAENRPCDGGVLDGAGRAILCGQFSGWDHRGEGGAVAYQRFGFCPAGEAARWIQDGNIGVDGELPVNTSGGLLSEAHVGGWNSIVEMVRQLRGQCGARQIAGAEIMQWATVWGDSIIFRR